MSADNTWRGRPEVRSAARRRRRGRLLFLGGLLAAALAALPPLLAAGAPEQPPPGADIVVCLDLSRSMLARDVRPSRLERARAEIRELAATSSGDRLALVGFAGAARLLVPLTADRATFAGLADLAEPASVPLGGTDLGAALDAALDALEEAGAGGGRPGAVILVSDGEDLGGRGREAAARCREAGLTVHCLGLGSPLGAKIPVAGEGGEVFLRDREGQEVVTALDPGGLEAIARATDGVFVTGEEEPGVLRRLREEHVAPLAARSSAAGNEAAGGDPVSLARWPLLAALLLWLLELLVTGRRTG